MRLSALAIRNAKPRDTPYMLGDGHGLYLLVKPSGTRLWRMNYAYMGRQKTLSFGEWPLLSLAEARVKRDEARRIFAAGLDPSEERKLEQMRDGEKGRLYGAESDGVSGRSFLERSVGDRGDAPI